MIPEITGTPSLTDGDYLETRRIRLLPLTETHLPSLYQWRNSPAFLSNCTNRRETVSYDGFLEELDRDFNRDRHEQFVIQRKGSGELVGTIYSYNLNKVDSYAFITIFLQGGRQHMGYGVDAVALFLRRLFMTHNLFKVYMEVYEYNLPALSAIKGTSTMVEEGRFGRQRFWNGNRYDVIRFAVFHDSLSQVNEFLSRWSESRRGGENSWDERAT